VVKKEKSLISTSSYGLYRASVLVNGVQGVNGNKERPGFMLNPTLSCAVLKKE
jgi:hypothetical protein